MHIICVYCVICMDICTRALFRCGAVAAASNSGNRDPIPDCSRSLCVNLKFRYFRFHMIILYIFLFIHTHDGCFVSFVVIWARTQINAWTLYTLIGSMGFVYASFLNSFSNLMFSVSLAVCIRSCILGYFVKEHLYQNSIALYLARSLGPFLFSLAFFIWHSLLIQAEYVYIGTGFKLI